MTPNQTPKDVMPMILKRYYFRIAGARLIFVDAYSESEAWAIINVKHSEMWIELEEVGTA